MIASRHRLASLREFQVETELSVHALIDELSEVDWVLVEGFKHGGLPKVEVWRSALGQAPLYPHDRHVIAVATDHPESLPVPTPLPVLLLSDASAVAALLLQSVPHHEHRA